MVKFSLLGLLQGFLVVISPLCLGLGIAWLWAAIALKNRGWKFFLIIMMGGVFSYLVAWILELVPIWKQFWVWSINLFLPKISIAFEYSSESWLVNMVKEIWGEIFCWMTLVRLVLTILCMGIGSLLYHQRVV